MGEWRALTDELDRWQAAGRIATFWWRDDDLAERTSALDRLLDLRERFDLPLALAVVPERLDADVAHDLDDHCTVLQHGFAHHNFAPEGEKKSEFPESRPAEEIAPQLAAGRDLLSHVFGGRFLAIMVPPWNRIADNHIGTLAELGFIGLSRYRARKEALAAPSLAALNTHVDLIDWHGSRSAVDQELLIGMITDHLRAKREGRADTLEPTGILTHHLVHDEAAWALLFALFSVLASHEAVRFLTVRGALALIDDLPDFLYAGRDGEEDA